MQLKTFNGDVAKVAARGDGHARALSDVLVSDASVAYAFVGAGVLPPALPGRLSLRALGVVQPERRPRRHVGQLRRARQLRALCSPARSSCRRCRTPSCSPPRRSPPRSCSAWRWPCCCSAITRFKRLIRGAVLLPFIVPTALSTLVWWWMFEPMYSVVNWTLKSPARDRPRHPVAARPVPRDVRGDPGQRLARPAVLRHHAARRPGGDSARALRGGASRTAPAPSRASGTSPCRW